MTAVLHGLFVGLAATQEEIETLSGPEGTRSPEDMNPSQVSQPEVRTPHMIR